jgi:hypothetical protein
MLIAYVDESYDRDHYFIGAAIATQAQWERVSDRFSAIRRRTAHEHRTSECIEFDGHELMGGSGPWSNLRGRHREAAGISTAVLGAAAGAGVRYAFRGVDVARLNARYRYPRTPHAVVFGHLLEQIDRFAAIHDPNEQAIVVADEIATQAEHQRAFAGYQAFGTIGDEPSRLAHISAPINFASSASSDGLQAVDMAVYVYFRRRRVHNAHAAAQRTLERQWELIAPRIAHDEHWVP